MKKSSKIVSSIPGILFIIYLLLDYFDIPEKLELNLGNIEIDLFSLFFNSLIVVVLYLVSFYLIDSRQIKKENNARALAKMLIKNTYEICKDNLELLNDSEEVARYIIPKVDGNEPIADSKVIKHLQGLPFDTFEQVMHLAESGYVDEREIENYLYVRSEYKNLVAKKIIFYDLLVPENSEQKAMKQKIDIAYKNVMDIIEADNVN